MRQGVRRRELPRRSDRLDRVQHHEDMHQQVPWRDPDVSDDAYRGLFCLSKHRHIDVLFLFR